MTCYAVFKNMKHTYKKIKHFYATYERFLIPGMLLLGFLLDLVTFKALNIRTAFILLAVHASIVGFVIIFLNSFDEGKYILKRRHPVRYLRIAAPLLLQFSMGALLSAVMIFYLFSGAFSVSWPFLIIVIFLMISNEIYREYYLQPTVQLPVYYLILFALGALMLPFAIKHVNIFVFALAGIIAMVIIYLLYRVLRSFVPAIAQEEGKLIGAIGLLFGGMLALYITNIIPPIPLSVREIGVYHDLQRQGNAYVLAEESESWVERLLPGRTVHITRASSLYVLSAIFAPDDLKTGVVHVWEWYDPELRQWREMDRIGFGITGGRDEGYRGYTRKSTLLAGKWRVSVATDRGKTMGRLHFRIEIVDELPELERVVE